MLFLLSNEEKQQRESNSAVNQEQKNYDKEKRMAAWGLSFVFRSPIRTFEACYAVSKIGFTSEKLKYIW